MLSLCVNTCHSRAAQNVTCNLLDSEANPTTCRKVKTNHNISFYRLTTKHS